MRCVAGTQPSASVFCEGCAELNYAELIRV